MSYELEFVTSNRPFLSSLVPLFQRESKCKTILMKMILICMNVKLHAELIFMWKVSHLDSFWNRGTRELRNGLLNLPFVKNKSIRLPFVTKNSKHLGETSARNSSPLIEFTPLWKTRVSNYPLKLKIKISPYICMQEQNNCHFHLLYKR